MNNDLFYYFCYENILFTKNTEVILGKDYFRDKYNIENDIRIYYDHTIVRQNIYYNYFYPIKNDYNKNLPNRFILSNEEINQYIIQIIVPIYFEKIENEDKKLSAARLLLLIIFLFFSLIFKQFYLLWIIIIFIFIYEKVKE